MAASLLLLQSTSHSRTCTIPPSSNPLRWWITGKTKCSVPVQSNISLARHSTSTISVPSCVFQKGRMKQRLPEPQSGCFPSSRLDSPLPFRSADTLLVVVQLVGWKCSGQRLPEFLYLLLNLFIQNYEDLQLIHWEGVIHICSRPSGLVSRGWGTLKACCHHQLASVFVVKWQ